MTMRRAMKSGSSPASIMRASQYIAASGSLPRTDLDERADDVVMVVALLVVRDERGAARRRRSSARSIAARAVGGDGRGARREFERAERDARVAVGEPDKRRHRFVVERDVLRAEAAFAIVERAPHERLDLVVAERVQHEHARAREQRRVDFERRILGRRADQRDRAVFDVRQDRVLLAFVEAMDLVDEEHGALARARARAARPRRPRANRRRPRSRRRARRNSNPSRSRSLPRASSSRCPAAPTG